MEIALRYLRKHVFWENALVNLFTDQIFYIIKRKQNASSFLKTLIEIVVAHRRMIAKSFFVLGKICNYQKFPTALTKEFKIAMLL